MKKLTHIDDEGRASMVDVGGKPATRREAVASAMVEMSRETLDLVARAELPKGDVLGTARIAGILAAKKTADLIPMTHPLQLTHVGVDFEIDRNRGAILIRASARCEGATGVEIEAMTACAIAAVTIYDMCKSVEKGIVIREVRLEQKSGGKSGDWNRSEDAE
ncbi:MAG: cyclic pyranopterin monophosphate synthase MoaC [Thermoanaerobaculia bacterium]